MDRVGEVGRIVHRLGVYLYHYISGAEAGLVAAAALFDHAHQHALAVFDAKEVSQLGSDVLDHETASRQLVDHDHRDRQIEVGHGGYIRHLGDLRHFRFPGHQLVAVRKLHLDGHGLTVAADAERDHAAGGGLFDHAAQLSSALYRSAVQADDDVMDLHLSFSGGSVLIYLGDLGAVLFL